MKFLIVACSQKKFKTHGPTHAMVVYNGPIFQMLRRRACRFNIFILSAEHGLISPSDRIEYYDRKMDAERAKELSEPVRKKLNELIAEKRPSEIFCVMGEQYRKCLGDIHSVPITFAMGPIGMKLQALRLWIEKDNKLQ